MPWMPARPIFDFLRNRSTLVEADKIPLSVRCDCCLVAAKATKSDTTIQWDNICLTALLKDMDRMFSHSRSLFSGYLNNRAKQLQQKAKQIYEAQKKKEEMTEAESADIALRRREFSYFVSNLQSRFISTHRCKSRHCDWFTHVLCLSFRFPL